MIKLDMVMSTKNSRTEETEAEGLDQRGLYNKSLSQNISTIHINILIYIRATSFKMKQQ